MKKYTLTLFVLWAFVIYGQKEDRIWYFGGEYFNSTTLGAGLDFNSGAPVTLTNSAMPYTEGSAIQCNRNGNLLFYTNGEKVWDRTHNVMQNGTNLGGGISSFQSSLIIPFLTDTMKYYLFANAGFPTSSGNGLYYSIIDMNLNGGLGDVTPTKAVFLQSGTSEWLAGNWHSNGIDYWVVTSDYNTNTMYSYLVSSSGISSPITSSPLANKRSYLNSLEFNNSGTKFTFVPTEMSSNVGLRYIADFNRSTGLVSNPIFIDSVSNQSACFSPDDNLFYYYKFSMNGEVLYQCDINATNIPASKQIISTMSTSYHLSMRLGPDQKIYCNDKDTTTLDCITNPNQPGLGCNFVRHSVSLNGRISGRLLPNKTFSTHIKPLGLHDNSIDAYISIFPNPFSNIVHVNCVNDFRHYKIIDSYGNLVQEEFLNKKINSIQFSTDITSGLYFLLLYDDQGHCLSRTLQKINYR